MHRLVMRWSVLLVTVLCLLFVFFLQSIVASDFFLSQKVIYEGPCIVESWEKDLKTLGAVLRCGELEAKTNEAEVLVEFLNGNASVLECQVSNNGIASCTNP